MSKERIQLTDSASEMIVKLAEGSLGASVALIMLMRNNTKIDPDSALGACSSLISLDSIGIYGPNIYILYKDICQCDVAKTIATLRACQLGLFNGKTLIEACKKQDRSGRSMVPVDELYEKVKERLPEFDKK